MTTASPVAAPTRVRYGVLGFACTLSMITYLDRVCFGSAAGTIQKELELSDEQLGWAFTAFAFAYAAFEIPSGWLGDVFGARRTLIRIVLWWSLFTVLTGLVTKAGFLFLSGFLLLVVVRLLFGVGEAGAYPNITRALHNWFPLRERGSAQGAVWMAGRFMGGMTPLVWLLVVGTFELSWRVAFFIFGGLGTIWCVAFYLWFRDRPREKPEVNAAEVELIEAGKKGEESAHAGVPWGKLLSSPNLWCLCLMYFCASYGWYFNITYLPKYMDEQFNLRTDDVVGALYKGGPLWMGAFTCLVGGVLSDRFVRTTGNRKWGRRLFGVIGHSLCSLCYVACMFAPSLFTFFLAISFAAFWNDLTMGAAWATCQDIGKKYAGIVAGCMNTVGNMGGAAAGIITGTILGSHLQAGAARMNVPEKDLKDVGTMVAAEIAHAEKDPAYLDALAERTGAGRSELLTLQRLAPRLGKRDASSDQLDVIAGELGMTRDQLAEKRKLRDKVASAQRARLLQQAYPLNFMIFAGVYALAVLFWLRVDATKPVAPEAEAHDSEVP